MKNLPATLMAALLTIAVHGSVCAADSEDSPYVIEQDHAAPVTVTESPDHPAEPSTSDTRKFPEEEMRPSATASEATSAEDQLQTTEQYIERRQEMIERCELSHGIDCAREVDTELGAETSRQDHAVHLMRPMGGPR